MKNIFRENAGSILISASIMGSAAYIGSTLSSISEQEIIAGDNQVLYMMNSTQNTCPVESVVPDINEYMELHQETPSRIGYDDEGKATVFFLEDGKKQNWSVLTPNDDGSFCFQYGGEEQYQSFDVSPESLNL